MDIAQVARTAGIAASKLRYYEDQGLIASVGRQGLRRRFDPRVLDQLALIALGHAAACPAPSHGECPSFQRLLRAALRSAAR